MKVLVTGGAGFIGSHLVLELLLKGYQVTVLDNLSAQIHSHNPELNSPVFKSIKDKVHLIIGDVTSRADWAEALKDKDVVIHLAAETGTGQSMYEIDKYVKVNIYGTALLMDFLTNQTHSVKKIIVASSRAIYGEGKYECPEHGIVYPEVRKDSDMRKGDFECKCPICNLGVKLLPTSEDSKLHPTSVYGITKQNQEQIVMTIANAIGLPAVAFRYQNVYGPGQSLTNPYTGILSIFSNQLRNDYDVNIFEDGKESRDFVFIDDVVDATILGLERSEADFQVLNVGSNKPVDVHTVALKLKEYFKSKSAVKVTGNYRLGDIRHNYADNNKIEKLLGFVAKTSFKEGISQFCNWVNQQEMKDNSFDESLNELRLRGLYR